MPVIALPSEGEGGLNDSISVRFGKCSSITIVSIEQKSIVAVKVIPVGRNIVLGNLGVYIAKLIRENNASDVIVKFIGSKAYHALSSENIHIFKVSNKDLDIKQCIDMFKRGEILLLEGPNSHLIKE
ncbi:MAG: NifB/NifX family molybdenum-iron cluster-binding protein [Candidatus Hermodarchaeota archaeon]